MVKWLYFHKWDRILRYLVQYGGVREPISKNMWKVNYKVVEHTWFNIKTSLLNQNTKNRKLKMRICRKNSWFFEFWRHKSWTKRKKSVIRKKKVRIICAMMPFIILNQEDSESSSMGYVFVLFAFTKNRQNADHAKSCREKYLTTSSAKLDSVDRLRQSRECYLNMYHHAPPNNQTAPQKI